MPRGLRIPDHQRQEILERFDQYRKAGLSLMDAYGAVGKDVGRSQKVIGVVVNIMRPTVGAARLYLRSKALRMAKKIVRDGNVSEMIDVLSRPSVGGLDPKQSGDGGGGNFFIAVSADTCGAVKVGVGVGSPQPQLTDGEPFNPFAPQPGDAHGTVPVKRFFGKRQSTQDAIDSARERLKRARDKGLQAGYEPAQGEGEGIEGEIVGE